MDRGRIKKGEKERDFCSLLWENNFPLFAATRHAQQPQTWRALRILNIHAGGILPRVGGAGFVETGASVWSIDQCCCWCPCLLCVSLHWLLLGGREERCVERNKERKREKVGVCETNRSGSLSFFLSLPTLRWFIAECRDDKRGALEEQFKRR